MANVVEKETAFEYTVFWTEKAFKLREHNEYGNLHSEGKKHNMGGIANSCHMP